MNRKSTLLTVAILSFATFLTGPMTTRSHAQETPPAQEAQTTNEVQIVKIRDVGYDGALRIEPREVTIPVGMVIVWVNMSRKAEPQIVFAEGMKCQLSTEASSDFKQNEQKCFITDYVQVGGSSSLKFIGPGNFKYEVVNKTGQKGTGTIIVK